MSVAGMASAQVNLRFAFEPPTLTVAVGSSAMAVLSLPGVPEGTTLMAVLHGANTATARVMLRSMMFTAETPRHDVTVVGVAEGSVTVDASVPNFPVGSPVGSVQGGSLVVTVEPAPVHLQLAFDSTSLTVAVGSVRTATLRLLGEVPAGTRVRAGVGQVRQVSVRVGPESVISNVFLDAASPSFVMTVRGVAVGSTTVRVFVMDTTGLPPDSTVEEDAQLQVTVVPAPPVMLQLAFDPSSLTVAVGSEERVVLSLVGVPEGFVVPVELSVAGEAASVVSGLMIGFLTRGFNHRVRIAGVAAGNTTLMAVANVLMGPCSFGTECGLPPGSAVASAQLPLTVVPAPVELVLEFDRSTLTVVAGAEAEATLRLPDVPAGATVWVDLRVLDGETARLVSSERVGFQEGIATDDQLVTVAGVTAGNTLLTAIADISGSPGLPPDSTVESAQLALTVVAAPVMLQLAFEPPALTVAAGARRTAQLRLVGDVPAGAAVAVELSATNTATAQVAPESVMVIFTTQTPSRDVTVLGVAAGGMIVTAVEDVSSGLPPNSTVAPAELAVTVVPAVAEPVMLELAFDPTSLTVVAGATATAVLSLSDVPEGTEVAVTLSVPDETTARVLPRSVIFTADTPSRDVTVEGVAAGSVTAVADEIALANSGLPSGSAVAPADLAVTVVLPMADLQLAFDPPTLTVTAGATATATLRLPGVPEGAEVTVGLSVANASRAQAMPSPVVFTAATTSREVTVTGMTAGNTAVTAGLISFIGLSTDSSVASAELAVTVFPPPIHLALVFDRSVLTITEGSNRSFGLRLRDNRLPGGVQMAVSLRVDSRVAGFINILGDPRGRMRTAFFQRGVSHGIRVYGLAVGNTTLTASVDADDLAVLPPGSTVEPAELVVRVVPPPVHLALAFDPTSLTVVEGATKTAVLSLPDVPAGAAVTVSLSAASTATAQVTPESVTFTATPPNRDVTVTGVAAGDTMVTAVEDVLSGLPPNSTVAPAELLVRVVPPPVHLRLAFESASLEVTAGATATATLSLLDVPAGAEVTVTLSAADAATARAVTESVVFSATTPSPVVTATVTVAGVAAGSVTLTAVADDISDLPPDSSVMPAELAVTVVLPTVDLQLAFEPSPLTVAVGSRTSVTLSLPGVPAGAEVTVTLSVADAATARIVTPESVTFTPDTLTHVVTVEGVAEGSVTVTADDRSFTGLSAESSVASAQLQVTVVLPPVHLALVFDPTSLTVVEGSEAEARLSLLGEVPADAEFLVDINALDEAVVSLLEMSGGVLAPVGQVFFDAATTSREVTVSGMAVGNTTVMTVLNVSFGLPEGSTVALAELSVTVVPAPVALQLVFDPSTLMVTAGATATATLSLLDVPAGAEVTVELSVADAATARLVTPESVVFSATATSPVVTATVTVAGVAAGSVTLTAIADVSGATGLPAGSTVASAALDVTVVPAPVHLQLAFDRSMLTIAVGDFTTAVLSLLGDVPAAAAVPLVVSSADDSTAQVVVESVSLGLSRRHFELAVRGVAAGSVTLTAVADDISDLPPNSSVLPADLAVTVVPAPVDLALAFEPPALEVVVGSEAMAMLRLSGEVPAGATVRVTLSASGEAAQVVTEPVVFDAATTSREVTVLGLAEGSATLMAVVDADVLAGLGLPEGSTVTSAELPVTVVLPTAELRLVFNFDPSTPLAVVIKPLTVAAGGDETATLSLLGDVPAGARVGVELIGLNTVARVRPELVVFTATTTSYEVTVEALEGVRNGGETLQTLVASRRGLSADSTVAPAHLTVQVRLMPVMLQLAFDPSVQTVEVGATATATLSLSGDVPARDRVTVTLSTADAATLRVVTESVVFDAAATSREVTVAGVAAGSVTLTAVADDISDLPTDSSVMPAELAVTVVLPTVDLQLAFDPSTLMVTAGAVTPAVLSLPDVPAGAEVTVELSVADAATAQVTPRSVVFDADTPSRDVTVTGVAAGSATLTAELASFSGLSGASTVRLAQLQVTVVPPPPIHFRLAFEPPTLTVVAGSRGSVLMRILGDIPRDAGFDLRDVVFAFMASSADESKVQVVARSYAFSGDGPGGPGRLAVDGVAEGSATVTMLSVGVRGRDFDLPPGSTAEGAQLLVTVVPPTVHLALAFDPSSLMVTADATATATLSLPDVPAGAEVTVELSVASTATARLVTPESVVFTAQTQSHDVTVAGVAEGSATLTAIADVSGLPDGSAVAPAELAVTVVPAPVHLQLAFEPMTLTVAVGSRRAAVLRLLGDVPAGAEVRIELREVNEAVADVEGFLFTLFEVGGGSREVEVSGVAEGITTITAVADSFRRLPAGSTVAFTELTVRVVPAPSSPVHLQLAFVPPTLTVTAGSEETAVLSLLDVPEGVVVTVDLSASSTPTAQVRTESVEFTAATTSRDVTVTGVAAGSATLTAKFAEDSGLPDGSTVALAELAVTVVPVPPVHLQLAFDSPRLTVVAGSMELLQLRLLGDVPEDATFDLVVSSADESTARVSPGSLIFSGDRLDSILLIEGVAEGSATVTAVALRFTGLPDGSSVESAELLVTVVPVPVMLQLAFAFEPTSLTVAVGATATAVLSLLGVPAGTAVSAVYVSTDPTKADVQSRGILTFDAATTSRDVTVRGVAAGSATIPARAIEHNLPPGLIVAGAELSVTVVPAAPEPVELQLAFDSPSLTLTVSDSKALMLSLLGVPEGATVTVAVNSADRDKVSVNPDSRSVMFTAAMTSHRLEITAGQNAGSVTVTAVADDSDLPPGLIVTDAELVVTVVLPTVSLRLAFDPTSLTVAAGSEATATLSLSGFIPAGGSDAEIEVALSVAGETAVQVMPSSVAFTAATMSRDVTVEGVTVGNATLTAVVTSLDEFSAESTVTSAELAVTVVPPTVNLQLSFAPPTLTVAVGATATAVLSLLDVPEGAAVTVTLSAPGEAAQVTPESVTFTAATTSPVVTATVTVTGVGAGSATLTAEAVEFIDLSAESTVTSAELAVTVVPAPVHLRLAFAPPTLTVAAGATATAVLSLLDVPAGAEVTVTLSVPDETTARLVTESELRFSATTPSHVVTIEGEAEGNVVVVALVGNVADFALPPDSTVMLAELTVTVVPPPVHLRLAFAPTSLTIVEDATATAVLSLLDVPAGAEVTVTLSVADATTARLATGLGLFQFDAATTSRDVTVLGVAAGSATLTAAVDADALAGFGLPPDSTVASADLALTVVPAPVMLRLAFDLPALTVAADARRTAQLRLVGDVPAGAEVTVTLSAASTAAVQVTPESVTFTAQTPSTDVTVSGVAEGSATLTAVVDADALAGSGLPEGSTVASAELAVTVAPAVLVPAMLELAFDPMSLEVEAGSTATAMLSLSDVPEGTEVEVTLNVADETTAQVLSQPVRFTADTTSHEVTVLGVAEGSVTVTASALDEAALVDSGLPAGSTVASADLAVTVVLPTVELQLAFAPPAVTVAVGATATAVLRLSGVPVGAAVTVAVFTEDSVTAQVVTEPEVVFDAATQSRDVTVEGVTVGNATLTAELASFDGLSTVSTVASAQLAVTVVPAPVHLQLAFAPPTLTVTAGATETAVLSLPDVPAGATVTVTLSAASTATAEVTPESVTFTAQTPSPVVTATVTVLGVAAGSVTVAAVEDAFVDSGLPAGSTVAPADLAVTVVPAPVHLQLAFAPPAVTVTAGATETAVLSLPDVPAGATVTVSLSAASTATAEVTPESVTFTAQTPSPVVTATVTVLGVAAGSVTVAAVEDAFVDSGLPAGSTVAPADLAVTVVPAPVHLQLAFAPPAVTVTAGATETAVLSLPDVPAGATVTVSLSAASTATAEVTPESVTFTAQTPSRDVTVLGVAAGSVTVAAVEDAFVDSGLPAGSTVASAQLAVTVVPAPVHFQLVFEPPTLTVAAGATEMATLSLPGVPADAAVTVTLSVPDATTARLVTPESVTFTAETPSYDVTVLGVAAGSVTLTAIADTSGLPPDSTVASVQLQVTVVEVPGLRLRVRVLLEGPLQ